MGDGKITKLKRVIDSLTGARKEIKGQKEPSYEVKFFQLPHDANLHLKQSFLAKAGFEKHMKAVDEKIAIREGFFAKPLTSANVDSTSATSAWRRSTPRTPACPRSRAARRSRWSSRPPCGTSPTSSSWTSPPTTSTGTPWARSPGPSRSSGAGWS